MLPKSITLLGESGMIGGYIASGLKELGYEVRILPRFDAVEVSTDGLTDLLADSRTHAIINCIGAIPQRGEVAPDNPVNAVFPHRLFDASERVGAQLIHISTDCVFSGARSAYTEHDAPDAPDGYGVSKAAGEPSHASVLRISCIGSERTHKRSLIEWVKSKADQDIGGYTNRIWNGVTALTLAHEIGRIVRTGEYWEGPRHFFSARDVSKYELVSLISDAYDLDVRVRESSAPEARDMTLRSVRGSIPAPDIAAQLAELAAYDSEHGLA
jgi:dTDP-4-dehydrorhamnose reductase